MPYFICPNCKQRSIDHDRLQEIDNVPVACDRCGFGFLFDKDGRILASGRGVFELSGYKEQELLGADLVQRFGLSGFEAKQNPAALALEWGVRRLGEKIELRTRAGQEKAVTADFFPAYDDDGGLLVALTPRS